MAGGAEPRGARLGLAGRTPTCPAGPLSDPKEGEVRWRGVAANSDRPEGSTLLPPPPPWGGGEGNMAAGGSGRAHTLSERERSAHDQG